MSGALFLAQNKFMAYKGTSLILPVAEYALFSQILLFN